MRLVAVTRILNEADIVEAFVRHTAAVVDHHILQDDGSTDGTLEILAALVAEGISLEVGHYGAVAFDEEAQLTGLVTAAVATGADWVLPLDCDEFVDFAAPVEVLRQVLAGMPYEMLRVRLRNYLAMPGDDDKALLVTDRILHAAPLTDVGKVIVKGSLAGRGLILEAGSHWARLPDGEAIEWAHVEAMVYAHFPVRSPWQWMSKCLIGWSKVLAAGPEAVAKGYAVHYRAAFETLRDDPATYLRSERVMGFGQNEGAGVLEPVAYRGGPLRYTVPTDYPMRAVPSCGHPALDPLGMAVAFYGMIEATARARGLDPDHPSHLSKVTRTL